MAFTVAMEAIVIATTLSACSVSDLERFATEASPTKAGAKKDAVPLGYTADAYLIPDHIINGGKQAMPGTVGSFTRMLVGDGDEIRFMKPVALAGQQEYLYIVDGDARIVFKYNLLTKVVEPIGNVGVQFVGRPGNIYVTRDLSFYIVDADGKQVLHFDANGKFLSSFQDPANLSRPLDVLVNEQLGEVMVADGSYSHIVVFDLFGKAIRTIGRRGTGPGRFRAITDMGVGVDGLYVVDRLELPVQVLGEDGLFKYSFGETELVFASAIAISAEQYVFVADKSDNAIRIYQKGTLLSKFGAGGSAPGKFREISDLWIKDGLLYVADSLNRRVQVLRISGPATAKSSQ